MLFSVPVEETFIKVLFRTVWAGSRPTKKGWCITPELQARAVLHLGLRSKKGRGYGRPKGAALWRGMPLLEVCSRLS